MPGAQGEDGEAEVAKVLCVLYEDPVEGCPVRPRRTEVVVLMHVPVREEPMVSQTGACKR